MEEEKQEELTPSLLKNMSQAKVFKDSSQEIVSIDFSTDGKRLVVCDQNSLNLYDMQNAKKFKTLQNSSQQIQMVRFTHHNQAVLCATKKDYQILYWSLHDNEIVQIFTGHTQQILSLDLNNQDDWFLTTSRDQTLQLWTLGSKDQSPQATLDLTSQNCIPVASFDNEGLVFAVAYTELIGGTNLTKIGLYDSKQFEDGCFTSFSYDFPEVRLIQFSSNGQYMLCATSQSFIAIVDAFKGFQILQITGYVNEQSILEASFTPDSNFVISGSENGLIHIWEIQTGKEVSQLEGHFLKSSCVQFSPTHCILVSACKNLIFWIPKDYGAGVQ